MLATHWTENKFRRYQKEHRGEGIGKDYKPWHNVHDHPSKSRVCRVHGWKTNRAHHLFSDNEKFLFYLFEWSDSIVDIREQYPLLDLDLAMIIASDMGIEYPKNRLNGTPHVLTTTFMLTVKKGVETVQNARTYIPAKRLGAKVAEHLELEKRYFVAKGIDWGIITEREIPKFLVENIEWVHSSFKLETTEGLDIDGLRNVATILKSKLKKVIQLLI